MEKRKKARKTAFRIIFLYSTYSLKKTELVKFFYALKGRNKNPGIIQRTGSKFLAKSIVDTSIENKAEFEEFFKFWNVDYETITYQVSEKPSHALFTYSTSHLKKKDLVRFLYALKGRGKSLGLIERTKARFLARSVLLVPASEIKTVEEFFSVWACDYEKKEVMINE